MPEQTTYSGEDIATEDNPRCESCTHTRYAHESAQDPYLCDVVACECAGYSHLWTTEDLRLGTCEHCGEDILASLEHPTEMMHTDCGTFHVECWTVSREDNGS